MEGVAVLKTKADVDMFNLTFPNGYVLLNGCKGVGLTGELANKARNIGANPEDWIKLAEEIEPFIHKSKK